MSERIKLRPDLSEDVQYNSSNFPIYLSYGILSTYPGYAAPVHWHDDIELVAVVSGRMKYNVNGEIIHLKKGSGIFVNARQLHYGFSDTREECEFICILFHPVLMTSSLHIEQQYLSPILRNDQFPYLLLEENTHWQQAILKDITQMYESCGLPAAELLYQSHFYHMWWQLYTNAPPCQKPFASNNRRLLCLKSMITFIESNYQNKITLEDICAAGNVGKTTCCKLFGKFINQTPNAYLISYRLKKAAELLMNTDMTIAEVCYETGFGSASYFTEMFRKNYDCAPTEFRKRSV